MEFAREKFREMQTSEPPKTPIEFSMEIPTFDGMESNCIFKIKRSCRIA